MQLCLTDVILRERSDRKDLCVATEGSLRSLRSLRMTLLLLAMTFSPCQAQEIKVGLWDEINTLYLRADKEYRAVEDLNHDPDFSNSRTLLETSKPAIIRSSPAAANSLLIAAAPDLVTTSSTVKFECDDCIFTVKAGKQTRKYRGSILIKPFSPKLFTVINQVELEDYLKGVVPAEMPCNWPAEALKAQALAARTYTLSMLGRRQALGYDLKSSVEDQVYLGYGHERPSTNAALKATAAQYLVDEQGVLVNAYFSSQVGRFSSAPETTWGLSPQSCLLPRKEFLPARGWRKTINHQQLNSKLGLGKVRAITVVNRSLEGRVSEILIEGERNLLLSGEEFRHKLGLRSTDFEIDYQPKRILLSGYGYGHGIGMSQYGAKYLAGRGKSYQEILGHYYYGAKLVTE